MSIKMHSMQVKQQLDMLHKSRAHLFETQEGRLILQALKELVSNIKTAYVLTDTPEQGENIYRILVNGETVIGFDLQYGDIRREALNVIQYSVVEWRKMIKSRQAIEKFNLAIMLSADAMNHTH